MSEDVNDQLGHDQQYYLITLYHKPIALKGIIKIKLKKS